MCIDLYVLKFLYISHTIFIPFSSLQSLHDTYQQLTFILYTLANGLALHTDQAICIPSQVLDFFFKKQTFYLLHVYGIKFCIKVVFKKLD